MASTSTGTPRGRAATPTAARAWRPASPKTSPNSSLAALTTLGWSVKSGVLATNPVTLTTRRTPASSPSSALRAASRLTAQVRAAARPSSRVTSSPRRPRWLGRPSTVGGWHGWAPWSWLDGPASLYGEEGAHVVQGPGQGRRGQAGQQGGAVAGVG